MPDDRRPWDAIVVGSGLGGLAAGAAFARKGKRVLVLERLSNFGGAATIYRHGSLTMEASLHETDGDTIFGPTSAFAHLGLQGALDPVAIDVFYEVRSVFSTGRCGFRTDLPRRRRNSESAFRKPAPGSAAISRC